MKTVFQIFLHLAWVIIAGTAVADEPPAKPVKAEIWNFEMPVGVSSKAAFEQWRAKQPPGEPQILPLDGLSIPMREKSTMVRVAGVLNAPITGDYAFSVHAPAQHIFERPDETELWILDDPTGEWRLAQCTGNPNKRSGRTRLEQGVPRRFELWTMGRNAITVDWEVLNFEAKDPATDRPLVKLKRQTLPSSALKQRESLPDNLHGDGLRDSWKQRYGLDSDSATGPSGPMGDPDGDNLPNWQEQRSGTDPTKIDTEGRDGLVRWELWRDIPGRYVFDLRRAAIFPTGQREVRFLDRLEIPTGNGDRYGSRVRGLLKPPVDGEYTFKIIADNSAELWLGETDSWQTKRLIAKAEKPGAGRLTWSRRGDNGQILPLHDEQIARVKLLASRQYYLEILHKQDDSQDHCAVAWVLPGTNETELIGARHLVSWQPSPTDTADDGLPDEWQRTVRLTDAEVDPAARHSEADPDRDGASNREEWLAATDPRNAADAPAAGGMLTSEAWTGIPGTRIAEMVTHPSYPARPDFITRVDNLDFAHESENYGVRLRGYLTAPDDGSYRFAIAGNNACILYLGESDDKFTKRVIARAEHGTDWRFFAASPTQQSSLVELERGKRYYIEVLFKRGQIENGNADHSSVAWTRPGRQQAVIAPEFFTPYQRDPRDLDDDDLPDDWEQRHALDPAVPAGDHGSWNDPDADGLENFREFQLGRDPKTSDVHGTPGLALWEYWDNREDLMPALRDKGGLLSERLWQDLRYPLAPTRREWRESLEAPRAVDMNYASRMRALIVVPRTGDYVFAVSSQHASELFLSPDESKFKRRRIALIAWASRYREWDNQASQTSAPVHLEAGGRYYIEALHAQGRNPLRRDHLCVAWKPPGADQFEVIGAENLIAFFRDPNDQDDDDLPDDWERKNGLSVDGSSGDGDYDKDGLTNREEHILGTRANLADTDGDGVSDLDELRVYGSNPLEKDAEPPKLHTDFVLGEVISPLGTWLVSSEGVLTSTASRGAAGFKFSIDTPGLYVVRLDARVVGKNGYSPPVPVSTWVDSVEIGRGVVTNAEGGLSWVTRWLGTGIHDVTIQNHNSKFNVILEITSLKLLKMSGTDESGDGMPDWYEKIIHSSNSFSHTGTEDIEMQVSPACIEGKARMQGAVNIEVVGNPYEVFPGIGAGWYVNVPLAEKDRTVVEGRFEGGAMTRHLNLVWVAVNPFQIDERLKVRVGDSMKFSTPEIATEDVKSGFSLSLDGKEIFSGQTGSEGIVRFERDGEHILEATRSSEAGTETRRITITAMKADFGPTFSIAAEVPRTWKLPDVSPQLTLDSDPLLQLGGTTPLLTSGLRTTALWTKSSAAQPMVLARLSPGGPILAASRVNVFKLVDAAQSGDAHVVEILPDGTRVVEISYMIEGQIPGDFSMWIDFAVTDAVFADGSTRYLLTAADFDESGIARVKIYKAPGNGPAFVCHWNRLFENDPDATEAPEQESGESE